MPTGVELDRIDVRGTSVQLFIPDNVLSALTGISSTELGPKQSSDLRKHVRIPARRSIKLWRVTPGVNSLGPVTEGWLKDLSASGAGLVLTANRPPPKGAEFVLRIPTLDGEMAAMLSCVLRRHQALASQSHFLGVAFKALLAFRAVNTDSEGHAEPPRPQADKPVTQEAAKPSAYDVEMLRIRASILG